MPRVLILIALTTALWSACPACSDAPAEEESKAVKPNRLKDERSPYLRQHQLNPVDWYPWGPEALALAKSQERPIFLSIGYAACHWCHVMEHESFEDAETAKILNEVFVCVKVDREERPDLDRIYMNAVQLFARGGWPMTVLLTPEGKPFWGGTYLPKENLQRLAAEIARMWKDEREKILLQADAVTERVRLLSDGPDAPEMDGSDADLLEHMRNALKAAADPRHGGSGSRPKFPPHTELLFYLDPDGADEVEQENAVRTLRAMEEGGIHDHVGGGFHRYSTDERWLLPHFEKMLYDNALLLSAYAGMYARTKDTRYRRVATRLVDWLEREMKRPGGGYASSLDADTEGEEGLTYTWTRTELEAALGPDDAAFAAAVFGFTAEGNFVDEATHVATGRNIVHLPRSLADVAAERSTKPEVLQKRIDDVMQRMLVVRAKRAQPGLDDKVITGWNALLVSGLVRAGVDLELPAYIKLAESLAGFLLSDCRREDGTLLRFPKGSGPEIVGFCEDYAHMVAALLDLADATGEARWATAAEELARSMLAMFLDAENGGFWATSTSHHETLVARGKEIWDSPIPSENGVAAHACLRLAARTQDGAFQKAADGTLSTFRPLPGQPRMASMLVQLFRGLRLRMAREEAGAVKALVGDVHLAGDGVQVDLFTQHAVAAPGTSVPIVVRIKTEAGSHAFGPADEPGGLPVRLEAAEGAPVTLERVEVPAPGGDGSLPETFEVRAQLTVPVDASRGPRKIELVLTLQRCTEGDAGVCFAPQTIRLDVPLRFDTENGPSRHPSVFK